MEQYINFFEQYRNFIDEGCPALVNAERDKAFEMFRLLGFPKYKSENYQYIDIEKIMKSDFGFYLKPNDAGFNPRRVFHCDVPNLDSYKNFAVNGHFFETAAETDTITLSDSISQLALYGTIPIITSDQGPFSPRVFSQRRAK